MRIVFFCRTCTRCVRCPKWSTLRSERQVCRRAKDVSTFAVAAFDVVSCFVSTFPKPPYFSAGKSVIKEAVFQNNCLHQTRNYFSLPFCFADRHFDVWWVPAWPFFAGAVPVIEKVSPMNQLVNRTAAVAEMQRAVSDVSPSTMHLKPSALSERVSCHKKGKRFVCCSFKSK